MVARTNNSIAIDKALRSLVGVSFALWRAVFLADRTGNVDAKNKDTISFLEKMVATNAINFSDDHKLREWTFRYYVDDACFRLQQLSEDYRGIGMSESDFDRFGPADDQWDHVQKLFEKAVGYFEKRLGTEPTN
jgi:hypothetical protein